MDAAFREGDVQRAMAIAMRLAKEPIPPTFFLEEILIHFSQINTENQQRLMQRYNQEFLAEQERRTEASHCSG